MAWSILPVLLAVSLVGATPPGIPSTSSAKSQLSSLTVAAQGSQSGYSRDLFPHWIDQGNSCNTREDVLIRDGTGVTTGSACKITAGSWYSPYDGATWTAASDVDIDHVVPLSNAWKSGASSWTTEERTAFANDLENPQLMAVTDNVNQAKGDKGPEDWQPPLCKLGSLHICEDVGSRQVCLRPDDYLEGEVGVAGHVGYLLAALGDIETSNLD